MIDLLLFIFCVNSSETYITIMTSKAEYLKRYLSDGNSNKPKEKKRKKLRVETSRVKILDDDVDFKSLLPNNISNTLDDDIGDDTPAVAEFVDERPQHVQELERFRQSARWKIVQEQNDAAEEKETAGGDRSKQTHDPDSDQDVPRRSLKDTPVESSSTRHDSDSDQSPPRRTVNSDVTSLQQSSRQRHDSDQSPPRRGAKLDVSSQQLDSRRRHDSDSDQSPPQRASKPDITSQKQVSRRRHDSDQSPPRQSTKLDVASHHVVSRQRHDSDQSPPRRSNRVSDSDLSPARQPATSRRREQKHDADSDLSPERRKPLPRDEVRKDKVKPTKTLGGATAGLQSAVDMRKESKHLKQREKEMFASISDDMLGRNAKTVVRDKRTGQKRNLEQEKVEQAQQDAVKAELAAKYNDWNKGIHQKQLYEERVADALHEAEKPLARYSDDADLDAQLRDREREGDTMLEYIRRKKAKGVKEKPVYRGPDPPPNRFGIRPGYRWDGVDRSNGFEKLYFTKLSEKKAFKDIAYKWSVENM